jgi:hypothetical protein
MKDLKIVDLRDVPEPKKRTRWGRWRFIERNNTLEYRREDGSCPYYIDLDEMRTSAQCLDWIFQLHSKAWMSDRDRTDLLQAIKERIDPQANLCSFGVERGKADRPARKS